VVKKHFKRSINFAVLTAIIIIFSVLAYRGMNIEYYIEKGNIRINWFGDVTIPIKDINQAIILDNTPEMTKMVGVEFFNIRQGTFSLEGIGRVKIYADDIRRKIVLLKTDKITYGITPDNPEQFVRWIGKR